MDTGICQYGEQEYPEFFPLSVFQYSEWATEKYIYIYVDIDFFCIYILFLNSFIYLDK